MNLRILLSFCIVMQLISLNSVMAQNETLKKLNIPLKEINVCDTSFLVLRTTADQQKQLTSDYSALMRLTEKGLDDNLNLLSKGSTMKINLLYLNSLEGKIDPEIINLYKNESNTYDILRKKISDQKQAEELIAKAKQKEREDKIASGELPVPRQMINNASDKMADDPEEALIKLNEIIEHSNFNNESDFIYELSDYQYVEIAELKVKCLIRLNRTIEAEPIYDDIRIKINDKKLHLNADADRLYLSKIILLKTELKDTVGLYGYFKNLKNYSIIKEETSRGSRAYAAIIASKNLQNKDNREPSVNELHVLALKAAEPYVKERYEKEEFDRRNAINPHWGKQIPSGSLFKLDKDQVDNLLGKSSTKIAEVYGNNYYEAFVYNTAKAKYHIVYQSGRASYIFVYPAPGVMQKIDNSELLAYGWKFDILNDCSRVSCGLTSTSGYIADLSYIDVYVEGGDDNYNICVSYHVVFYSSDKKIVDKIVVY